MRKTLLLAATMGLLVFTSNGARAYRDGPWCAVISLGGGFVSENCSMPSFEVCREEALRFGTTSFCRQNGYFRGDPAASKRHRLKKRRRIIH